MLSKISLNEIKAENFYVLVMALPNFVTLKKFTLDKIYITQFSLFVIYKTKAKIKTTVDFLLASLRKQS